MNWPMPVDNLWTTRRLLRSKPVDKSIMLDTCLTTSVRSIAIAERLKAYCSRVHLALTPRLCLLLGVMTIQMQPAQASNADQYRLYAHSSIISFEQFSCFQKIIFKESRWNPKAVNGSHYGLGQMRSKWYRNLDPYRQIDATILYIKSKHQTPCKAWDFHKRNNWY